MKKISRTELKKSETSWMSWNKLKSKLILVRSAGSAGTGSSSSARLISCQDAQFSWEECLAVRPVSRVQGSYGPMVEHGSIMKGFRLRRQSLSTCGKNAKRLEAISGRKGTYGQVSIQLPKDTFSFGKAVDLVSI